MRHQGTFHFEWADTITGALDHIVCTAYKPKITVFIFPGNVSRIVDTIIPSFVCTFRITVVLFKQSQRLAFIRTNYDLSLFAGFHRTTVVVYQVYIILRIGQSHATRFRFHPRHSGDGQGGFCLSESFHQFDTSQFLEGFEYSRVQCFTGNCTILQGREVVLRQVFVNEETEDGGRGTKRGYMIILYLLQNGGRSKLFVIIYEYICSGNPLSVKFAPYSLSPAGIGNGKVQAVFRQVVPETTGDNVSQRISEVMGNHFRLTCGSAGEVHQRNVFIRIRMFRFHERCSILDAFVEIIESFSYFRSYADEFLHAG